MTGRFEMPISVTPRIPKNASCDVCGARKFKSMTGKLYTLDYSLSQNETFFPRKVLMVHLPPGEEGTAVRRWRRRRSGVPDLVQLSAGANPA